MAEKTACETCDRNDCSASAPRTGESDREFAERRRIQSRLCRIGRKVIVLSGKGGVGKSTVAVHLASALRRAGRRVGLLDVDIHGPSIPTMLGLGNQPVRGREDGWLPVEANGLKVMSLGFLISHPDDAVIWRGPMKMSAIRQFLGDVEWGDLDDLIIDSPPGTGDEPLSVCQLIDDLTGAVIVTTPQKVAAVDVRKSITFCRRLGLPVLGVVENMAAYVCPKCGETVPIFGAGGGRTIAADMGVPFLGSVPLDPAIVAAGDAGRIAGESGERSPLAEVMSSIIDALESSIKTTAPASFPTGPGSDSRK
jgi:ATP-binding protein involved in chromosome partitioning